VPKSQHGAAGVTRGAAVKCSRPIINRSLVSGTPRYSKRVDTMRGALAKCVNTIVGATSGLIVSSCCLTAPLSAQEMDRSATRAEQLESAADLLSATGLGDWHLALAAPAEEEPTGEVTSTFEIVDETSAPAVAKQSPLSSEQITLRDRVRRA